MDADEIQEYKNKLKKKKKKKSKDIIYLKFRIEKF